MGTNENGRIEVTDFLSMTEKNMEETKMGKHFSVCLMNPPYSGKLHEKFLEKALEITDKGISIQPAVFINKANKKRKSFQNIINKLKGRIKTIDIIPHREMNDYFGTGNSLQEGGIFMWDKKGDLDLEKFGYKNDIEKSLFEKTNIDDNDEMVLIRWNKQYKYVNPKTYKKVPNEVPVYQWHGADNCYNSIIVPENLFNSKAKLVLVFNNENEANNFKESLKGKFANWFFDNYVVPGDYKILTYMFRMKDYSKPWTDERFYKYFKLTDKEIDFIENYKNEI